MERRNENGQEAGGKRTVGEQPHDAAGAQNPDYQ